MIRAVADTHTVIWYLSGDTRLSAHARSIIDLAGTNGDQVAFSASTLAEIVYLIEKGRIPGDTYTRLSRSVSSHHAVLVLISFDATVADYLCQVERSKVPDTPDRIIAATALSLGVPLISRDRKIQVSAVATDW